MTLWETLLLWVVLTLNLLGKSNVALNVLAYAYMHGAFNYKAMPLAPLGCSVWVHEATAQQRTWEEHH